MENLSSVKSNDSGIARSLMLLEQLSNICERVGDTASVVPVKGIALLQTLYAENFDRDVSDIDIVIFPAERLPEVVEKLVADGSYRLQFEYMREPAVMLSKRKACLLSNLPHLTDVDIHTAFITKKFFRTSCQNFNEDAFARLRRSGDGFQMDGIDEWLFLAQHACFHHFSNAKWLHDLFLLQRGMDDEQLAVLGYRTEEYGFGRVVYATRIRMAEVYPGNDIRFALPLLKGADRWKRFAAQWHKKPHRRIVERLVYTYDEFMHIEQDSKRRKAYMLLFFPSLGVLSNIYRVKKTMLLPLYYILNLMVSAVSFIAFQALFMLETRK